MKIDYDCRFQGRENKRNQLKELREQFEKDKQRIQKMKGYIVSFLNDGHQDMLCSRQSRMKSGCQGMTFCQYGQGSGGISVLFLGKKPCVWCD